MYTLVHINTETVDFLAKKLLHLQIQQKNHVQHFK